MIDEITDNQGEAKWCSPINERSLIQKANFCRLKGAINLGPRWAETKYTSTRNILLES